MVIVSCSITNQRIRRNDFVQVMSKVSKKKISTRRMKENWASSDHTFLCIMLFGSFQFSLLDFMYYLHCWSGFYKVNFDWLRKWWVVSSRMRYLVDSCTEANCGKQQQHTCSGEVRAGLKNNCTWVSPTLCETRCWWNVQVKMYKWNVGWWTLWSKVPFPFVQVRVIWMWCKFWCCAMFQPHISQNHVNKHVF